MIPVSTTYDNLITKGAKYEWRIQNGTSVFGIDKIIGGTLATTLFEQLSIGNVISTQLDLSLRSVTVDATKPLVLQFRANFGDGAETSTWYTKGTYYIDTIEASPYSEITKILAFDALIKASVTHQKSGTWQPITAYNLANSIAVYCGISLETATATLLQSNPITLSASPNIGDNGTTKAEMLSCVAALYGGSFVVNNANKLELIQLNPNPADVAAVNDAVRDFDASPAETIKRVRMWTDDTTAYLMPSPYLQTQAGTPIFTQAGQYIYVNASSVAPEWEAIGGRVLDVSLPFYGNMDTAQRIYDLVKDKSFIPYTTNRAFVDPKYEVGDGINVKDITSIIANQILDVTPLAPSQVNLQKEEVVKSTFERNVQFNLAKHGAQIDLNTQAIEAIPDEIERATTLITGGYGGYVKWTYLADGTPSELLFMDSPEEATATNILRINRNGIGFSTDGGATYRNAWTIDGRLNADFIKTGTINADLIKTGTLTADVIGANSINVSKLSGQIANNNWVIDLDNGTLAIGNISADNINTGTLNGNIVNVTNLNANNIVAGTLTDATGKNSWNLNTGEFVTKRGTIGSFTIDDVGLNGVYEGAGGGVVTLTPKSLRFVPSLTAFAEYVPIIEEAAGQIVFKLGEKGSSGLVDEIQVCRMDAIRRYVSAVDPSQGYTEGLRVSLDNGGNGYALFGHNENDNPSIIMHAMRIYLTATSSFLASSPDFSFVANGKTYKPFNTQTQANVVTRTSGAALNQSRLYYAGKQGCIYLDLRTTQSYAPGSDIFVGTVGAAYQGHGTGVTYRDASALVAILDGTSLIVRVTGSSTIPSGADPGIFINYLMD